LEALLIEPIEDGSFESYAVIAEGMIRLELNMCGICASGLLERFEQCFAVWGGAIICGNQQDGALAQRRSELQEVPFVAMIEDLAAKCVRRGACQGQQIGRVCSACKLRNSLASVFRL
jgi:hypothetical protein